MSKRIRELRARSSDDDGFTLVELLVSMMMFAIVLALVSSAVLVMEHGLRKAQGQSDNLDASRKVLQLLDRQVRYANAITQPGVGATGTSTYIEWQSGDTDQQNTCTQWRFDSTAGTLGYRTWKVPATLGASATPTAWVPQAFGVTAVAGTPVFTTTALPVATASPTPSPTASPTQGSLVSTSHAGVTVVFNLRHGGNPSTTSQSQVTLTAVNTSGTATGAAVCSQTLTTGALRP